MSHSSPQEVKLYSFKVSEIQNYKSPAHLAATEKLLMLRRALDDGTFSKAFETAFSEEQLETTIVGLRRVLPNFTKGVE